VVFGVLAAPPFASDLWSQVAVLMSWKILGRMGSSVSRFSFTACVCAFVRCAAGGEIGQRLSRVTLWGWW
jgi:hypothetical protein